MNRIAKSVCMIAVLALAFTACKKNETGTRMLVFNGTTEQMIVRDENPGAKVYLDLNNKIRLEEGDSITIINIKNVNDPNGADSTTASTFGVDNKKDWIEGSGNIKWTTGTNGAFFAYYPGGTGYTKLDSINNPNCRNWVTFTLVGVQNYAANADGTPNVPKNAFYIAAKNDTKKNLNDASFKFKSICGILGVRLYSPSGKTIKMIEVEDNAYNITGEVSMKIHEVDPDEMTTLFNTYDLNNPTYVSTLTAYMERIGYYTDYCSKSVKLDCGSGVSVGNDANGAKEFYIVLRPLALAKGGKLKITLGDDRVVTIPSTLQHCISPNTITRLMAINVDAY